MLNAHFLTVAVISGSIMVTPVYVMAAYVFSDASPKKGIQIGAAFLIEMARGHIPGIFAYPAGIGDILVGVVAGGVLLAHRKHSSIPGAFIYLVVVLGVADFLSAFFFGFTSTRGPLQLFFPAAENRLMVFPTGMIPQLLVPYAIFFHVLSVLNYLKFERRPQQEG